MRFISLFLLFTLFIYATSIEKLQLPKCLKYESMKKVIDNDWSYADKHIKKFMENNATTYVNIFMNLVNKPLVLKTDEEYIKEQIIHHKEFLQDKNLTGLLPTPIESIDEYSERITKEVKYKIYFFERYRNIIKSKYYRGMYLYIRYLEHNSSYEEAYNIYKKIAQHLLKTYQVNSKDFIHFISYDFMIDEYIQSLSISIQSQHYTTEQKRTLYHILAPFLNDEKQFSKMMEKEKDTLYKLLDMFFLDKDSSADSIIKNERFFKSMLKIIDEKNLKKHLNNKQTMIEVVKNYKFDIEQIHDELLSLKTIKEYKAYVEKKESLTKVFDYLDLPRLFVLYMADDLEYKSVSNAFKYNFSSSEFIEFVRKFYIFYGEPWVWGKYKFEYEERLEKNKKFLELLKN